MTERGLLYGWRRWVVAFALVGLGVGLDGSFPHGAVVFGSLTWSYVGGFFAGLGLALTVWPSRSTHGLDVERLARALDLVCGPGLYNDPLPTAERVAETYAELRAEMPVPS